MSKTLSLQDVLRAYSLGLFPMAERADSDDYHWYDPDPRGQLSIENLHIPQRLRTTIMQFPFEIRIDTAFADVIDGCAAATPERTETWINKPIRDMFIALHAAGHAHSIECWKDGMLAGGVYGLALGAVFCGESMFSRDTGTSKIALVHLCARLWKGGFHVLDTQYVNDHLRQFGVYEISRDQYRALLRENLPIAADFTLAAYPGLDEKTLIHQYFQHKK